MIITSILGVILMILLLYLIYHCRTTLSNKKILKYWMLLGIPISIIPIIGLIIAISSWIICILFFIIDDVRFDKKIRWINFLNKYV